MILKIKYQYGKEKIDWTIYCDLTEEERNVVLGKLGEIIKLVQKESKK